MWTSGGPKLTGEGKEEVGDSPEKLGEDLLNEPALGSLQRLMPPLRNPQARSFTFPQPFYHLGPPQIALETFL